MTAQNRRLFLTLLGVALALLGLGIYKVTVSMHALTAGDGPAAPAWLPALLVENGAVIVVAFTAGQLWRVYTHARGIRKSGTAHVLGRKHR